MIDYQIPTAKVSRQESSCGLIILETIWGPGGSGLRVSPADEKGARGEACGAESRLSPAGAEGGSGPRDSWIGFVDQGYFGKSDSLSDLQKIALLHHG